jgi:Mg2+/citrate symporter
MTNLMKSVGNFQANVGMFSADLHLIITYITAGILIIIGIGLAVVSFVPMKPWVCNEQSLKDEENTNCNPDPTTKDCKDSEEAYMKEKTRCNTKAKQPWLLWFLVLIPIAIIMVLISRWWNHLVHTNRTAAQIGGTISEAQIAKNIFS